MRWLREKSIVFRALFFGGLALLLAGAIFAYIVLAAVHESPLRAAESVGPAQSGDDYVARAADCVACHSVAGGKAFAGGLKMGTPLGATYSTNITPDPETGIGRYSPADFDSALRQGNAQEGRH